MVLKELRREFSPEFINRDRRDHRLQPAGAPGAPGDRPSAPRRRRRDAEAPRTDARGGRGRRGLAPQGLGPRHPLGRASAAQDHPAARRGRGIGIAHRLERACRVCRSDRIRRRAQGSGSSSRAGRYGPVSRVPLNCSSGGPAGSAPGRSARVIPAGVLAGLLAAFLGRETARAQAPTPTPTPTPTPATAGEGVFGAPRPESPLTGTMPKASDGARPRARGPRRRQAEDRADPRARREDHGSRDRRLLPGRQGGRPLRRRTDQAELQQALGLRPVRGRDARKGDVPRGRRARRDRRRTAHRRGPRVPGQQEAHDVAAQGQAQGRQGRDPRRRARLAARRREGQVGAPRGLQGRGLPLRGDRRARSRTSPTFSAASSSSSTKATRSRSNRSDSRATRSSARRSSATRSPRRSRRTGGASSTASPRTTRRATRRTSRRCARSTRTSATRTSSSRTRSSTCS